MTNAAPENKTLLSVFTPSTMLPGTLEAIFVKREGVGGASRAEHP
jgi:hypothetical protein